MTQRVFFFSGMGADHRAFQYLELGDVERVYIDWIEPLKDENLQDYAYRMVKDITFLPDDVLVGLSLGGFIVQEIAAIFTVKKVILLSSLRSGETLQPLFTAAQKLHLLNLINADLLKTTMVNGAKFLFNKKGERIQLMVDMIDNYSGAYYKWAMGQVLQWNGADAKCPVYHVHGSKDEIFPVSLVKDAEIIEGGTHLMLVMKAKEVSTVLQKFLAH